MTTSSRALIVLCLNVLILAPIGASSAFSETQEKEGATEAKPQPVPAPKADTSTEHKEVVPEKPAPRPQHHPADSDSQPAPHKPSTDTKPQPAPAPKTGTSTEHKEAVPDKPVPRPQHPPAASDSPPVPHKPSADTKPQPAPAPKVDVPPAEPEGKEKDPGGKKPLGSLILSVKLALMGDSRLFRYEIEVEGDQQTVTLSGRVTSEEEKVAATEVAQVVHGVKTVINKIALEKDLAKTLLKKQDEILTTLVKERFAKSATLKAANFEVKTEDGVVQLNGTVRFQVIALEAAETARQVPGVRAVNTEKIRLEGES
ncbi:MAG: BON domain-containing protein [Nitrospiraceae bacterium]